MTPSRSWWSWLVPATAVVKEECEPEANAKGDEDERGGPADVVVSEKDDGWLVNV
jgi:hypothetical protein